MKKWEISRRTLLRGVGAAMALPLLEQMLPSVARAQATGAPPPRRLVAFYVPNGIHMAKWTPAATGASYTMTEILQPLAPVKSDLLVLTGLANRPAQPDGAGDHASGTGAFITARHPVKTNGAGISNGISMDQVAANAFKQWTKFPSLELGVIGGGSSGDCDSGYSCAYANNISWANATTPLAKEINPQAVFDRLFAAVDPNQTPAAIARRKAYKQSVLDAVKGDSAALKGKLGKTDRTKLEQYEAGIRDIEVRLQSTVPQYSCDPGARPNAPTDIRERTKMMLDLMVLAFQCDVTRVATFMLGNAGNYYVYNFLGLTEGHHTYSHHQGSQANYDALTKIDIWEMEQFSYLLQKMKAVIEPDGTMLDNSAVFLSSEIEDGDAHRHTNMPVLVAGKAGGNLTPGRHVRYSTEKPVANLFVSLLDAVGVPTTSFGQDSTGPLDQLKL